MPPVKRDSFAEALAVVKARAALAGLRRLGHTLRAGHETAWMAPELHD